MPASIDHGGATMFYTDHLSRLIYGGPQNVTFDTVLMITESLDEWGLDSIRAIDPAIGVKVIYGGFAKYGWSDAAVYNTAKLLTENGRPVCCPAAFYRGDCYIWMNGGKPVYALLGAFSLVQEQTNAYLTEVDPDGLKELYANVCRMFAISPAATDVSLRFDANRSQSASDRQFDMLFYEIGSIFTQLGFTHGEPTRSLLLTQLSLHGDDLLALRESASDTDAVDVALEKIRSCLVENDWKKCDQCGNLSDPSDLREENGKLVCRACRRKARYQALRKG